MNSRRGSSHGWSKHTTEVLDLKISIYYNTINRLRMTEGVVHHIIAQTPTPGP
jgi:hypothetical protein